MNWVLLSGVVLALAAIPAVLTVVNFFYYQRLPLVNRHSAELPAVSVLIPARNEAANIAGTLESLLASCDVNLEVIVLDDHSTDGTAGIVDDYARRDPRVRLEVAPPLPSGWCGKPHACQVLAGQARHPWLMFIDADVQLMPGALGRMVQSLQQSGAALASGVPRQILGTFFERLLLPLIHFVLLGYLPLPLMRWTRWPAFSAGCGQLFAVRREAYERVGGHAMIRSTLHDGLQLPRLFRRGGFRTQLFDATDLASCRMYRNAAEVWRGLGKNATEGLAAPGVILPMSALLLGGQVLPWLLLGIGCMGGNQVVLPAAGLAVLLSLLPRLLGVICFQQPLVSAMLHPIGVLVLLVIQWVAWVRKRRGRPAVWKGRNYGVTTRAA